MSASQVEQHSEVSQRGLEGQLGPAQLFASLPVTAQTQLHSNGAVINDAEAVALAHAVS